MTDSGPILELTPRMPTQQPLVPGAAEPGRWTPFREPLSTTLLRNGTIALLVGGIVAWRFHRPSAFLLIATFVLWFSLGGHWVELWFCNWLRPRISDRRLTQVAARVLVWFLGGMILGAGSLLTMRQFALTRAVIAPPWWEAGVVFIAVELIAHSALAMRHRPNFFRGDG